MFVRVRSCDETVDFDDNYFLPERKKFKFDIFTQLNLFKQRHNTVSASNGTYIIC